MIGGSRSEEELKVGRSAAGALSTELVKALKDLDLPIGRAGAAAVADGTLAIEGQAFTEPKDAAEADAKRTAERQADQGDFRRAWMDRGHASKVVGPERASLRPPRASQCRGDMT